MYAGGVDSGDEVEECECAGWVFWGEDIQTGMRREEFCGEEGIEEGADVWGERETVKFELGGGE